MKYTHRNSMIDVARLVFCFCIIFLHMNPIRLPSEPDLILCFGYLGVEFFFIVSGYLMANSAERVSENAELGSSTWKFLSKKLVSIFPYYFISWIFAFIVALYPVEGGTKDLLRQLFQSVPYLMQLEMAGFQVYSINGPTWFLSAMFLSILILYPLLLKYRSTFTKIIAPVITIWSYGYLISQAGGLSTIEPLAGTFLHTGMLRALAGLSLGCVSYEATKAFVRYRDNKETTNPSVALTVLEVLLYVSAVLLMRTNDFLRPDFLVIVLCSIAIIISFSNQSYTYTLFKKEHLWIGKLTMCLYLSNYPARNFTVLLLPEALNISRLVPYVVINIIFGCLVMLFGDCSYKVIKNISNRQKVMI